MSLHEKYESRGLTVMMLSTENKSLLDKYVPANKIPYVVGTAAESAHTDYGVRAYPSSFLIDGSGKVVWEGHPMALSEAQVEEALKTVVLFDVGEVAKSLASAKLAGEKGLYGEAAKKARAKLDSKSAGDEEKADAQRIVDKVDQMAEKHLARAEAAAAAGDLLDALEALKYVQLHFKGHEAEKTARDREKEISSSEAGRKELSAMKLLGRLLAQEARMRSTRDKRRLIPVFEGVAKKYAGTQSAKRAAEKADELRSLD